MNAQNGYDIEDLQVGMTASFSKTITEADIILYSAVSGDTNALHLNGSMPPARRSRVVSRTAC